MLDELGDRMKGYYEDIFRISLPKRSYALLRIDGKSFHTYTKRFSSPFSVELMNAMNSTAHYLCQNISGAKLAFIQSDEISILITDFDNLETQAWFNYNVQKMVSVSASFATAKFNQLMAELKVEDLAHFDSRTWVMPTKSEVANYFVWRNQDTIRNSISSVAQSKFSHKQLEGKSQLDKLKMLSEVDCSWEDYPDYCKFGRIIYKDTTMINDMVKSNWLLSYAWKFTEDRQRLLNLIPDNL